jgi:hypothetical protein
MPGTVLSPQVKKFPIYLNRTGLTSRILKLAGWESGERRKEREGHGMKMAAALWQEISVNNTSPKYIGRCNIRRRHSDRNVSDTCFWIGAICSVIYTGKANTYPTLPAFHKYVRSVKTRELDGTCAFPNSHTERSNNDCQHFHTKKRTRSTESLHCAEDFYPSKVTIATQLWRVQEMCMAYVHVCESVCMCRYACVCVYACMYVCMYVCMHSQTHIPYSASVSLPQFEAANRMRRYMEGGSKSTYFITGNFSPQTFTDIKWHWRCIREAPYRGLYICTYVFCIRVCK